MLYPGEPWLPGQVLLNSQVRRGGTRVRYTRIYEASDILSYRGLMAQIDIETRKTTEEDLNSRKLTEV